jgi:drug/metabolite transporter (DMT)-like permease
MAICELWVSRIRYLVQRVSERCFVFAASLGFCMSLTVSPRRPWLSDTRPTTVGFLACITLSATSIFQVIVCAVRVRRVVHNALSADATVLTFLSPLLTGLLATLLLGESYVPVEAIAGILSLGGVLLIAKPEAIFGSRGQDPDGQVTSQERLQAVG